eukprot:g82017.t1
MPTFLGGRPYHRDWKTGGSGQMRPAEQSQPSQDSQEDGRKTKAESNGSEERRKPISRRGLGAVGTIANFVLTISFFVEVVVILFVLRTDHRWLLRFLAALPAVCCAVYAGKGTFRVIGRVVSPLHAMDPLKNPVTRHKWEQQGWQLIIHGTMATCEATLLNYKDFLVNPKRIFAPGGGAGDGPEEEVHFIRWLYIVQMAIWVYTAFSCRFYEARRKDYLEMMGHHVLTLALVIGSWCFGWIRIGVLVLYLHDVSDIFVDMLKITNYMKLEDKKYFFLVEISLVSLLGTWVWWRMYNYPLLVWSLSDPAVRSYALGSMATVYQEWAYSTLVAFLWALMGLHCYWYYLMWRIAVEGITAKTWHSKGSEHYEYDSDEEHSD